MRHTMEIKIYYEDTDCGGVVYYANYLRYMERARTEYMETRGASVKALMDHDKLREFSEFFTGYSLTVRTTSVINNSVTCNASLMLQPYQKLRCILIQQTEKNS